MSKRITVKYNNKDQELKAPLQYSMFLALIKSTFKHTDESMKQLVISYKDPDVNDQSDDSNLLIEGPDEYDDFLNVSEESWIILKKVKNEKNKENASIDDVNKSQNAEKIIQNKTASEAKSIQANQSLEKIKMIEERSIQDDKLIQRIETLVSKSMPTINNKELKEINESLNELKTENEALRSQFSQIEKEIKSIKTKALKPLQEKTKQEMRELIESQANVINTYVRQSMTEIKNIEARKNKHKYLHKNISCNGECEKPSIEGMRFKCSECSQFNLCENCYEQGQHSEHFFIIIPNSAKYNASVKEKKQNNNFDNNNNYEPQESTANTEQPFPSQSNPSEANNTQSNPSEANNTQSNPSEANNNHEKNYFKKKSKAKAGLKIEKTQPKKSWGNAFPKMSPTYEQQQTDKEQEELQKYIKEKEQEEFHQKKLKELKQKEKDQEQEDLQKNELENQKKNEQPGNNWENTIKEMDMQYEILQSYSKEEIIAALKQTNGAMDSAMELLEEQKSNK